MAASHKSRGGSFGVGFWASPAVTASTLPKKGFRASISYTVRDLWLLADLEHAR
jgi:hypothetical protein